MQTASAQMPCLINQQVQFGIPPGSCLSLKAMATTTAFAASLSQTRPSQLSREMEWLGGQTASGLTPRSVILEASLSTPPTPCSTFPNSAATVFARFHCRLRKSVQSRGAGSLASLTASACLRFSISPSSCPPLHPGFSSRLNTGTIASASLRASHARPPSTALLARPSSAPQAPTARSPPSIRCPARRVRTHPPRARPVLDRARPAPRASTL